MPPAKKVQTTAKMYLGYQHFISPSNMPRQRSKKLSADRKPAEKAVVRSVPEENSSDSDNESDDSMAKDDEEDELERLVLGDRGDFKAQLSNTMDVDDEEHSAKEDGEEEGEDEAGLENVDDADVGTPPCLTGTILI